MKKTIRMELRLTPDEKNIIKLRANLLGVSMTKYVVARATVKQWRPKMIIVHKADPKLIWQIQGIARNINQIAFALNLARKRGLTFDAVRIFAALEAVSRQNRDLLIIHTSGNK